MTKHEIYIKILPDLIMGLERPPQNLPTLFILLQTPTLLENRA